MQKHSIGFVAFGKRDGFELLFKGGDLEAFQSQENIDILSKQIQLKLEEIRIFPGSEILGSIQFKHQGNWYKVFTLYRYTLDIYKRDGFYAGAVIFQNSTVEPEDLLDLLQTITNRTGQKLRGENYESGFKVPMLNEDFALRHIEFEEKSSFTPLASCEKELYIKWLEEMLQIKRVGYQLTFASGFEKVIEHFDRAKVAEIIHPQFSPKPKPIPVLAEGIYHAPLDEKEIKEDSMIYEFEVAEDDRWSKKPISSHRTKNINNSNLPFLQSRQKLILAIGIAVGITAGIVFLIG